MADCLSHEQAQELLGAQAVGALDEEERRRVDDHLLGCDECRRTLRRLQRAATALGGSPEAPPPHVWERIKERLRRVAPEQD